jgi:UDP-N-acetylmuramoyl-tripeptide--D-alanyl-D-alanine ligase
MNMQSKTISWREEFNRLKSDWFYILKRYSFWNTTFIAVTGSCGKTSATYFLSKILSDCDSCFSSIVDNGKRTVKMSLRSARRTDRFFVHEAGVGKKGDLAQILSILRPQIGIVTSVGQDHYRAFRTLEATAAEKGVMVEVLPRKGVAVLNADDPYVANMRSRTRSSVLTYGMSPEADIRASAVSAAWPDRLSLTVTFGDEQVRIKTQLFGTLAAGSLLAAIAGAVAAGISLRQCAISLKGVGAFPRRMSVHQSSCGAWFINDTVKAPHWSIEKVLALLETAQAPRKTIVLGAISDVIGSSSRKYRSLARNALTLADRVVFVGDNSMYVRKLLCPELEGRLFAFEKLEDAVSMLSADLLPEELVLVKSNLLDHLERLILGVDQPLFCHKEQCEFKVTCEECFAD